MMRRPTLRLPEPGTESGSHPGRFSRTLIVWALGLCLSLSIGVVHVPAAGAQDMSDGGSTEASTGGMPTGEEILTEAAKAYDALLIRPLATARVILGTALMIPASIFSAPSGMEGLQASYDTLIDAPVEYAFRRELGDFSY